MTGRNSAVDRTTTDTRSIVDWVKLGIGVLGALLLVVFFAQNRDEVDINFLWMEWNTGLIWALLVSAVLGALSAVAFSTIRGRRRPER